jgi:hypothetical protein
MRIKHISKRSALFLTLSTLVILLSAVATLSWQWEHRQGSMADGGNVVGPPSLSAATVNKIFARVGSPMVGTGKVVEQASRKFNIDDAFALAVWWAETNDGAAGVGRANRNPGGVRGSPAYASSYDGYTIYPSYADAITDWFNILQTRYISRGQTSVYTLAYPYVGTSGAANWAVKVTNLMLSYRGEAPLATPTPTTVPRTSNIVVTTNGVLSQYGVTQEGQKPATIAHKANTSTKSAASTLSAQPFSAMSQLLIVIGGLLAAIAVALWGLRIRRGVLIPSTLSGVTPLPITLAEPSTPLPPLYANEYSPVLATRGTEQLSFLNEYSPMPARHETEQLPFPNQYSPVLSKHGTEQLPFPEWTPPFSPREQDTQPLPAGPATPLPPVAQPVFARAGMLKRYHFTEASPTETRQDERVLEPVGMSNLGSAPRRSGGLLQRYGTEHNRRE